VSARVEDGVVTVLVEDDGRGVQAMQAEEGHVGLRLLASLMTDVGGHLELRDAQPTGTVLEARFPAILPG
jgi:nitrate/nitrite-specific signal transduction histidine kinase